jgi:hypothetical protein
MWPVQILTFAPPYKNPTQLYKLRNSTQALDFKGQYQRLAFRTNPHQSALDGTREPPKSGVNVASIVATAHESAASDPGPNNPLKHRNRAHTQALRGAL